MKNISKKLVTLCLALLLTISMVGCGKQITSVDGGTKVSGATITSWYGENNGLLDTSININFDEIAVADIDKVTFELYQDDTLLGNAVSEGKDLVTLLKDCAQYWEKTEETYKDVKGTRTMSCAFSNRTEAKDNGYWFYSICTATNEKVPNKLTVKVLVNETEYVAKKA